MIDLKEDLIGSNRTIDWNPFNKTKVSLGSSAIPIQLLNITPYEKCHVHVQILR